MHLVDGVNSSARDKAIAGGDVYKDGSIRWDGSTLYYFFRSRPKEYYDQLELKMDERRFLKRFKRLHSGGLTERLTKLTFKHYMDIREWCLEQVLQEYIQYCDDINYTPLAFKVFEKTVKQLRELGGNDEIDEKESAISNKFPPKIKTLFDKKTWLHPYNETQIPFIGRDEELALLEKFLVCEGNAKVWAIIGPSGSGKTRLVHHWITTSKKVQLWECRFLSLEDRNDPTKWRIWEPKKPTLIILDLMFEFEQTISEIIKHLKKSLKFPVRFLVLDHEMSEPIKTDKRWGIASDGVFLDLETDQFFAEKPLLLTQTTDQDYVVTSIIESISRKGPNDPVVIEVANELKKINGAWHPLYAALTGEIIKNKKIYNIENIFHHTNSNDLIYYYLSGEREIWNSDEEDKIWAACFICVAIAQSGLEYKSIINYSFEGDIIRPSNFYPIIAVCRKIVPTSTASYLPPFEPDILGENFFILCISSLEKKPGYRNLLIQMLCNQKSKDIESLAIEFVRFFERLSRNINTSSDSKKNYVTDLLDFLNPKYFHFCQHMRAAASISRVILTERIRNYLDEQELKNILADFKEEYICNVNYQIMGDMVTRFIIAYYGFINKYNNDFYISKMVRNYLEYPNKQEKLLLEVCYQGNAGFLLAWINYHVRCNYVGKNFIKIIKSKIRRVLKIMYACKTITSAKDKHGETMLHYSVISENFDLLLVMLKLKKTFDCLLNTKNKAGEYPLHWMRNVKSEKISEYIVSCYSKKIDLQDKKGNTLLIHACANENYDLVNLLIKKEAKINHQNKQGFTPIFSACKSGNIEIVKLLLNSGADTHHVSNNGENCLHQNKNISANIIDLLVKRKVPVDAKNESGLTPLHIACINDNVAAISSFLKNGADINKTEINGCTPLVIACANGNICSVETLLKSGADVTREDFKGADAIISAIGNEHRDIISLLVKYGADIHTARSNGLSPLQFACSCCNDIEIVFDLVSLGADMNKEFNGAMKAIDLACFNKNTEVSKKILLEFDDDISKAVLVSLLKKRNIEMISFILNRNNNLKKFNDGRDALLFIASGIGDLEVVKRAVEMGSELSYLDNKKNNAIDIAKKSKHRKVAMYLEKRFDST